MSGAIPPLHQYAFMAWCLVKKKHRDNFIFEQVTILTRKEGRKEGRRSSDCFKWTRH
jgi:hypothetical protein